MQNYTQLSVTKKPCREQLEPAHVTVTVTYASHYWLKVSSFNRLQMLYSYCSHKRAACWSGMGVNHTTFLAQTGTFGTTFNYTPVFKNLILYITLIVPFSLVIYWYLWLAHTGSPANSHFNVAKYSRAC